MADNYDDFGATENAYRHMPITQRIPWHAERAIERLKDGDERGAKDHAQCCITLCAAGMRFTLPYMASIAVLKAVKWPTPNDYPWG